MLEDPGPHPNGFVVPVPMEIVAWRICNGTADILIPLSPEEQKTLRTQGTVAKRVLTGVFSGGPEQVGIVVLLFTVVVPTERPAI